VSSLHPEIFHAPIGEQLLAFVDEHRSMLASCLNGLTEQEARASLVSSKSTLLGLVKHATFVEKVWLVEAVTGQPRSELGIEAGPDESFDLTDADTIASVRAGFVAACDYSRAVQRTLGLDDVVSGNRRGPLPMRWVYLHLLREHAQHCGHADILREQILAGRD
jgi:hypothetical protein